MGRRIDEREQRGIEELSGIPNSTEEIALKVAKIYGMAEESKLCRQRSSHRQARSVFIELCRRYLIRKMLTAELGRRLGNISGSAICLNRKRLEEAMKNNRPLRQLFQRLERDLKR
jgi:hypothetical protein